MKLFLAFIIAGFFMAADPHLQKKCFAPVYCLPSDLTESRDATTTWAQVYPPLIEAAPDNPGCSITSNHISAEEFQQIVSLEKECKMLNASLYRETEKAEQQIMKWEEKLSSLEVKLNETTQNCTDELQRQLNVKERWLRTIEIEIDKNNQLNENLTLAIKEKEGLNESLVQTEGKLDEEIDERKRLNKSLMLEIKEKERLNESLVQAQEKLDEEINKSKQLNESLMLATKEKERLNESLVQTKEELVEERNKSPKLTQEEADRKKNAIGVCPIFSNDKCFFFDMRKVVLKKEAENRCACSGGILGNIYDETHLNKTMTYVRENYMTEEGGRVYLWLGMTYENDKVYLSNKTEAKYWKWDRRYPKNNVGLTSMNLLVRSSTTSVDQYMWNTSPAYYDGYPFCEL